MTQVMFKLDCLTRRDENAGVYVGYIPALNIFTQASAKERLEAALESAASLYIVACHRRKLLDRVLTGMGFNPTTDLEGIQQAAAAGKCQYITVFEDVINSPSAGM